MINYPFDVNGITTLHGQSMQYSITLLKTKHAKAYQNVYEIQTYLDLIRGRKSQTQYRVFGLLCTPLCHTVFRTSGPITAQTVESVHCHWSTSAQQTPDVMETVVLKCAELLALSFDWLQGIWKPISARGFTIG